MGDFSERLKKFLKVEKDFSKCEREFWISEDIEKTLKKGVPHTERVACMKSLQEILKVKKFSEQGITRIFGLVRDLLEPNIPQEIRHATMHFLSVVALSDCMGNNRLIFYHFVLQSHSYEDTAEVFKFLRATVKDGEDIVDLELDLPEFIVGWIPELLASNLPAADVMQFCSSLLKHHSIYFDAKACERLTRLSCDKILECQVRDDLLTQLSFLESIVEYAHIPSEILSYFCGTLARACSGPDCVEQSWKVMRRQMHTISANATAKTLCDLLARFSDKNISRGCIYFITRSAWTSIRSPTLHVTPMYVLPFLFKTCQSVHSSVVYETAISIQKLVQHCFSDLHRGSFERIFLILRHLAYFADHTDGEDGLGVKKSICETLDKFEYHIDNETFWGPLDLYYDMAEHYSTTRPVRHIQGAMDYNLELLQPEGKWMTILKSSMHRHFKLDPRPKVRLHALKKLTSLFYKFRFEFGEQIIKDVVLTELDDVHNDPDMEVRGAAANLLIDFSMRMRSVVVIEMLDIIEQIILKPYDLSFLDGFQPLEEHQVDDVREAIVGLISFFKHQIWARPSSHAIKAYHILMNSLEYHYRKPDLMADASSLRKLIFEMVFEMRADANYHLGLPNCPEAVLSFQNCTKQFSLEIGKYTPFIIVDHRFGEKPNSDHLKQKFPQLDFEEAEVRAQQFSRVCDAKKRKSVVQEPEDPEVFQTSKDEDEEESRVTRLSLSKAARVVIVALKSEYDWTVLKLILEKLPEVLQNKALVLSKDGNDVDYLAMTLCDIVIGNRSNLFESLKNAPPKFTRSDLNSFIYPVLSRLASYHQDLDFCYQINVIKSLQYGMLSKSSPQCVSAMTVCVFEMKRAMIKQLREVMIALSKISATVHNAQPTLEFLSTLLHLPRIYSDFLPDQYMAVFAIVSPYTNPFKFNHYVVSLAYHVIAMWFLSCRIQYRKRFVNFIAKHLHTMVSQEAATKLNDPKITPEQQTKIEEMVQFHSDLRETCVDFMSKYCFDAYSPDPKRSDVADMLVHNGEKQMWLIGTRIITITTSGCTEKALTNGVCAECHKLCSKIKEFHDQPAPESSIVDPSSRRRHRSEYHRSVSHEVTSQPQTKDDLHMESKPPKLQSFLSQETSSSQLRMDTSTRNLASESGQYDSDVESYACGCWCKGWAEISIKQPTGSVSWIMRLLNSPTLQDIDEGMPVHELTSLYIPSLQSAKEFPIWDMDYQEFLERFQTNPDPLEQGSLLSPNMGDWSSGSAQSSGNTSRASSELRVNQIQEDEAKLKGHTPVVYCHSYPEINVKLSGEGGLSTSKEPTQIELPDQTEAIQSPIRTSVRRSNSIVETSTQTDAVSTRTRHTSALQMRTNTTCNENDDPTLQPIKRGRGHTISDMNPSSRSNLRSKMLQRRTTVTSSNLVQSSRNSSTSTSSLHSISAASSMETISQTTGMKAEPRTNKGAISPSATFLQLFYQGNTGSGWNRPILLPIDNSDIQRSVKLLDYVKPQENHKIGVLYVSLGQSTESEILNNTCGPMRYRKFLQGIGKIHDIESLPEDTFLGGMDRRGDDGPTVYMWEDHIMQVVFHVATNMPNKESGGTYVNKKRLIGNNHVTIVYNDSLLPYDLNTLKSQFNHSVVEIIPGDHNTNRVRLLCKPEVGELMSWTSSEPPRLVSDASLPVLARQLAVHANLASMVSESLKRSTTTPYATNWLERLRKIRKIREKVLGETVAQEQLTEQQKSQFQTSSGATKYLDFHDMVLIEKGEPKDRSRNLSLLNRQVP